MVRMGVSVGICLTATLLLGISTPHWASAQTDQPPPPEQGAPPGEPPPDAGGAPPPYTQQSPEQLQQLVAPIALYPDPLVAQILAASTYPEQVVEADRFVQGNPGLTGEALAQAANQQPWDPSVKGLTAFPAVLGNMDKNLSWTSSLGDAYYNQPQDVMNAIQVMRQRAEAAGTLRSTPQELVQNEDSSITIEPENPDVVYVPAYDPWAVYGAPIYPWPDWYDYPGIWFGGPLLSFGIGFPIGFFRPYGWGWGHWGFRWRDKALLYGRRPYVSSSTTFYNRGRFYAGREPGRPGFEGGRTGFERGGARPGTTAGRGAPVAPRSGETFRPGGAQAARPSAAPRGMFNGGGALRPFNGSAQAARGYAPPRGQSGIRSGAFSGYNRGGEERGFAARGAASVGGGPRGGAPGGGGRGRR
jgi:hypothetical protein